MLFRPKPKPIKIQYQSTSEVIQFKCNPVRRVEESANVVTSIGAQGKEPSGAGLPSLSEGMQFLSRNPIFY